LRERGGGGELTGGTGAVRDDCEEADEPAKLLDTIPVVGSRGR
jgi:hypothetical protein